MKIVRMQTDEGIVYGTAESEGIRVYRGSPLVHWEATDVFVPFESATLLSPVLPSKVVAIGMNYADHIEEMGHEFPERPFAFIKPSTSVIGPGAPIIYPAGTEHVDHEGELAVVIGVIARNVPAEDVSQVILGYTVANDVTARDIQKKQSQLTIGKSFDTFCPLGPAITTEFDPSEEMSITVHVNGKLRQDGSTADMVFGVAELIEYVTSCMTLLPGDVILTGTPSGVGPVVAGDRIDVEITGIGVLSNPVVARV
jgi:2-keto-4-pentenoate hydratase/2-oxohepta-3-ene-1,7-dioic acid hydratase in catechol pathway